MPKISQTKSDCMYVKMFWLKQTYYLFDKNCNNPMILIKFLNQPSLNHDVIAYNRHWRKRADYVSASVSYDKQ